MDKTLKNLNLEDDFLFAKVMTDSNICRKVLECILDISIDRIEIPNVQSTIDILLKSKGIRLDIYVKDGKGTVFNCEMQRGKKKELPKRTRYYQGNLDLDLIAKGMEVEFMTLMQRDMEMMEEGMEKSIRIIKLYLKKYDVVNIAEELEIDVKEVEKCILEFERK